MNSFALFVVVLLAALVNFSSAANSCSRFVTLNLQSPASSTIGVKTKRVSKDITSSRTQFITPSYLIFPSLNGFPDWQGRFHP